MPRILVKPNDETFEYQETKQNLLDLLMDNNIYINNPCSGKGLCGKCRVKVLEANSVNTITATESELLTPEEIQNGVRLACLVVPTGDMTIQVFHQESNNKVLSSGYVPDFEKDIDVAESSDAERIYGCAIDIGTTTVVTSLVDLRTGREATNSSMINPQKVYGLDVITRITYELEHQADGVEKLQKAIVDSINDMIADVCNKVGITNNDIYKICVAANCTMMHMLLGVDATSIGKTPYTPAFVEAQDLPARDIGIAVNESARIYCLPSVSSFIGADIVAGAYVCELNRSNENVLFVDIGTNGEMILSDHGRLLSCSCAAGPALEGMNISSGMRAADGAIEDIEINEKGVRLKVIGNCAPVGICGSGILAAVKELVAKGFVRAGGAFYKLDKFSDDDYRRRLLSVDDNGKRSFVLADEPEKLRVTQDDIRQVQLAKGAILSGIIALVRKAGMTLEDIDKVIVAGQFGAHLPAESLIGAGILPEEVRDKLVYVGNSSKTGAYLALMSNKAKRELETLAADIEYMDLGTSPDYEKLFAECLAFPV